MISSRAAGRRGLLLRRWTPLNILDMDSFIQRHDRFVVLALPEEDAPYTRFEQGPVGIQVVARNERAWLLSVSRNVRSEGTASRVR